MYFNYAVKSINGKLMIKRSIWFIKKVLFF